MPVGTDPKMNPNEEQWGILYDEKNVHDYCVYLKGDRDNLLRRCGQGSVFNVEKVVPISDHLNDLKKVNALDVNNQLIWHDRPISFFAEGVTYSPQETGSIYRLLNRHAEETFFTERRAKPLNAIINHLRLIGIDTPFTSSYNLP